MNFWIIPAAQISPRFDAIRKVSSIVLFFSLVPRVFDFLRKGEKKKKEKKRNKRNNHCARIVEGNSTLATRPRKIRHKRVKRGEEALGKAS